MVSFIFSFFKENLCKKESKLVLFINRIYVCFLFILYVNTNFCLTNRQSQQIQPLLEVIKVLWFLRPLWPWQSTDHPGWLPPGLLRREKIRMWLLLGWTLEYTIATVPLSFPHISAARALSPLSLSLLCLACSLDSGIAKFNFLLKWFRFLTKWWLCFLHINLWSRGWKELDSLIFTELDHQPLKLLYERKKWKIVERWV